MVDITHIFGKKGLQIRSDINKTLSSLSPEQQLIDAISAAGLTPPKSIQLDGEIHRFRTGTKGFDKAGDKPGWYVAFDDNVPAGRFGCWRSGIEQTWRADIGRTLSPSEEIMHIQRLDKLKALREKAREKKQVSASEQCNRIWEQALPADNSHPYLQRKGIEANGARVTGDGRIVVPLYDDNENLCSLQYIDSDGGKLYHSGASTKARFFRIGQDSEQLYIAEGFATAATIHETTGKACIVAYSASNIVHVAEIFKDKTITIVADNDESGVGQKYADQASAKFGCKVIVPPIKGDANDYHQSGHDLNILLNPPHDEWLINANDFCSKPAPIKWLIKGWIQQQAMIMVHGPSGGGKTFIVLDWCLSIASSKEKWSDHIVKPASVVYLAGEGHHGLRGRVAAWRQKHNPQSMNMWLSKSGCDLNAPSGYNKVVEQIRALPDPPGLIVVDTLHRFLEGDENSAKDAKTMLDACSGLIEQFGCSVMLVHHTGVSDEAQHRARGSSAWRGALDIEISVTPGKNDGPISIHQKKSKDAELSESLYVDLQKVEIDGWFDEDGEQVTSAVIEQADAPITCKKDTKLLKLQNDFESAWWHTGAEEVDCKPYVSRAGLINYLMQNLSFKESAARQAIKPSATGKMINELITNEIIEPAQHGWIVTCSTASAALLIKKNAK